MQSIVNKGKSFKKNQRHLSFYPRVFLCLYLLHFLTKRYCNSGLVCKHYLTQVVYFLKELACPSVSVVLRCIECNFLVKKPIHYFQNLPTGSIVSFLNLNKWWFISKSDKKKLSYDTCSYTKAIQARLSLKVSITVTKFTKSV